MSSSPTWSTKQVPGQAPKLHRETLSQKTKAKQKNTTKTKDKIMPQIPEYKYKHILNTKKTKGPDSLQKYTMNPETQANLKLFIKYEI